MLWSTHEGRMPRFERRISEKQENFVRGNTELQNPMFFVANTKSDCRKIIRCERSSGAPMRC
jgi:hypothetical protein